MTKTSYTKALTALLPALVGLALLLPGFTHDEPMGGYVQVQGQEARDWSQVPMNLPTWDADMAEEFPGCVAFTKMPGATHVVVVHLNGQAERMPFLDAWAAAKHQPANTIWTVGVCRP